MEIKKIISLDKDSREVDVLVTDGKYEILAYGHPIENIENQDLNILFGFICENVVSTEKDYSISKLDGFYSYEIIAKVVSKVEPIVAVGDILIELDTPIPNDIETNMKIRFTVKRIDIV